MKQQYAKIFINLTQYCFFVAIKRIDVFRRVFIPKTLLAGSFFPPRDKTGADIVHVWDKDLCRVLPLQYRGPVEKMGIKADLYTPPDTVFDRPNEVMKENECFCSDDIAACPAHGLQNISPCQYSKCRMFS